jgi:hypothetical protein
MIKISVTRSVLQVKTDRLTEVGKCNVMETNVERSKVMRISRHPFPVQIMKDQKQLENVEYLNYLGSLIKMYT